MSVAAFTNARGHFYRSKVVKNTIRGHSDGFIQDSDEYKGVMDAYSHKGELVRSNRIDPTAYGRAATNITEDIPLVFNEKQFIDGELRKEHTHTRYLSPLYPTMFMSPPASFYVKRENARKRSVTEALNDLREVRASFGADLAEGVQTANMIADSMKQVWAAMLALKHGRKPNFTHRDWWDLMTGKKLSNRYLEYVYGWLPLMNSAREGMELFTYLRQAPKFYLRASKSSRVNDVEVVEMDDHRTQTWVSTGRHTVVLYAYVNSQGISDVDSAGLLNPATVAWELVPWSFVVDWGIPVGSFLSALSATAGLSFLRGYSSETQAHSFRVKMTTDPRLPYNQIQAGKLRIENFNFQRTPYGSFPLPELYGKENPFSTSHITSAVALFRQLFR